MILTKKFLMILVLGFLAAVQITTLRRPDMSLAEALNFDFAQQAPDVLSSFLFKTDPSKLRIPNNRTLWIIMGNLRGGENAWESLYRNVLDKNDADLALAVGVTRDETSGRLRRDPRTRNSTLYWHAKYVWEFEEFEDWTDALDMITHGNESWHRLLDYFPDNGVFGGCRDLVGSGAVIFWIRWFISQMLEENDYAILKQYGRFVVTRSDHYYLCPHDLNELDINEVYVPDGSDRDRDEHGVARGVTDRHVVAPNHKILQVLDILPPVLNNPDYYMTQRDDFSPQFNPEAYVFWSFKEHNITAKDFPRTFFTSGVAGDSTRWSSMTGMVVPEGVRLKYTNEYQQSFHECWDRNFTKQVNSQGFLEQILPK